MIGDRDGEARFVDSCLGVQRRPAFWECTDDSIGPAGTSVCLLGDVRQHESSLIATDSDADRGRPGNDDASSVIDGRTALFSEPFGGSFECFLGCDIGHDATLPRVGDA